MKNNVGSLQKMKLLRKDTGQYLRKKRMIKGLSGYELGSLLNISQQQISRYELGISVISIDKLGLILEVLDAGWCDFFFSVIARHSEEVNDLKTMCICRSEYDIPGV